MGVPKFYSKHIYCDLLKNNLIPVAGWLSERYPLINQTVSKDTRPAFGTQSKQFLQFDIFLFRLLILGYEWNCPPGLLFLYPRLFISMCLLVYACRRRLFETLD
jgi:hypothetical protein